MTTSAGTPQGTPPVLNDESLHVTNNLATLVAVYALVSASSSFAEAAPGQGTWETTLKSRDFNGDSIVDAYYDTALNITWLADANYALTSGFNLDGLLLRSEAAAWASGLNVSGVDGWRLPTLSPVNGIEIQYVFSSDGSTDWGHAATGIGWGKASELGHMFYVTLANKGLCNSMGPGTAVVCDEFEQPDTGLINTGPFVNATSGEYWTDTAFAIRPDDFWFFDTRDGRQDGNIPFFANRAWAVRSGDVVAAVPELETGALMLAGLGAVAIAGRRRAGPRQLTNVE